MALQFVLGSAGSGKSGYVFRKTVKEKLLCSSTGTVHDADAA